MPKQETRQRGQIIPKGTDKFLVRVFLKRDEAGKRHYTSETVTGTRKDAEKTLAKLLVGSSEQTIVQKSKLTLRDHLKAWLAGRVDIGKKAQMDYLHRMEKDVYPFPLADKPLTSLTREILQAHIGILQTKRELGPRTIRYTFTVLKSALEDAVISGHLVKNPANYVKLPKKSKTPPKVLSAEQMQSFLARTAQGDIQRYALWSVFLTAGFRPQEALALKWSDVTPLRAVDGEPESAMIRVTRALNQVGPAQWEVGDVKTEAGKRSVPVPPETWAALKTHRARQAAEIMRAGAAYERNDFIFASRKHSPGKFLDIGTTRRWFKAALKDCGLPEVSLYAGTRHSHLTAYLANGGQVKVAQERAGHGDAQTTLNNYVHVLPGMQQGATDAIGALLFKRTGTH